MNCLKQVLLSIISLLVFLLLLLPLHLYRLFVLILPKGRKVYKLCSLKTGLYAGLQLKSPQMGNILIQARLASPVSVDAIRKGFSKKVDLYPDLKCLVTSYMGYPCLKWEDNFSLENHIVDETAPLDNDTSLQEFKAKLLLERYPKQTSPWCIHLVKCKEEQILLFRIHHVLGDGYSILQLLEEKPLARPFIPVKKWQVPFFWLQTLFTLVPPVPDIPLSGRIFPSGKHFVAEPTTPSKLAIIKEIKRSGNVRFAAIPAITFSFSVRQHLESKGLKVEELAGLTTPAPVPGRHTGQRIMNES